MSQPFLPGRAGPAPVVLLAVLLLALPGIVEPATREAIEAVAAQYFTPEEMAEGRAYTRPFLLLFLVQTVLQLGILFLLATRFRTGLARLFDRSGFPAALRVPALLTTLVLLLAPLRFCFSILRWRHASAFEMRHDGFGEFVLLWLKGTGLDLLLTVGVGWLIWRMVTARRLLTCLAGWLVVCGLTVGYVAVAPLVIDPWFQKTTRLADRDLEARLLAIAARGGVPATEVWVAEASRRTRSANASFNGFAGTRRIVVYDTLLENFSEPEVAAVVAHEAGHWRRHHIAWGVGWGLLAAGVGMALAWVLVRRWERQSGRQARRTPSLVIPGYALYVLVLTASMPVANGISRHLEQSADRDALVLSQDRDAVVAALVRLARNNKSDILPPPGIEFLLYTHPAPGRRLYRALEGP